MGVTEQMKKEYLDDIYKEMANRGIEADDIPRVIAKTGFISALNDFPEEQLHYDTYDAVNEILATAAASR